jgi:hypothetical protein
VIKRVRFATRSKDLSFGAFSAAWPDAVALAARAPAGIRPSRAVVCISLPEPTGPGPRHDGIGIEWFADVGHLDRFQEWLASPDGRVLLGQADAIVDRGASPVVVAREHVLRGADWLERRWLGGAALKHMAMARRAPSLTPAEFSRRWRNHAGQAHARGAARAIVIPDAVRGRAYVQNHPSPREGGEWAYDALNEVYFDDMAGLLGRIEWFRQNPPQDDDLFGRSWFIAAREEIVACPKELWSYGPLRPTQRVRTSSMSGTGVHTCPSSSRCRDSSAPDVTRPTMPAGQRRRRRIPT